VVDDTGKLVGGCGIPHAWDPLIPDFRSITRKSVVRLCPHRLCHTAL
jgi:hypothetical protein